MFSERTNASSHNARNIVGVSLFTTRQVTFFLQSIRNLQDIFTKGVNDFALVSWWILEDNGSKASPASHQKETSESPTAPVLFGGGVFQWC